MKCNSLLDGLYGPVPLLNLGATLLRPHEAILKFHREHKADEIEQAIRACLKQNVPQVDSIHLHLRREKLSEVEKPQDLASRQQLLGIGEQSVNLGQNDLLLRAM